MKKKNTSLRIFDFDTFDFSKLGRELTEEELYIVNGGKQIENSNEAVANAQIGDTLKRKDGTIVTINQGDIDYAKKQIAGSTNSNGSPVSSNTGAASGNDTETSHVNTETAQNNTPVEQTDRGHSGSNSSAGSSQLSSSGTGTGSSTQSSSSSGNSTSNGSSSDNPKIYYLYNTSAKVDEINEIVSFEKDDIEGAVWAARSFSIKSNDGFALKVLDKGEFVESFVSEKAALEYINKLDPSKGNLSEELGEISTITSVANTICKQISNTVNDTVSLKISNLAGRLGKVSFLTGGYAFILDAKKMFKKPTFSNITKCISSFFGGIPDLGPIYSQIISYEGEQIGKAVRIQLQQQSKELQTEKDINNLINTYNASPLILRNMDLDNLFDGSVNYGLNLFFEEE